MVGLNLQDFKNRGKYQGNSPKKQVINMIFF